MSTLDAGKGRLVMEIIQDSNNNYDKDIKHNIINKKLYVWPGEVNSWEKKKKKMESWAYLYFVGNVNESQATPRPRNYIY